MFFGQSSVLLGRSFWPKHSLVTFILFELFLLWYLAQSQILVTSLYISCLIVLIYHAKVVILAQKRSWFSTMIWYDNAPSVKKVAAWISFLECSVLDDCCGSYIDIVQKRRKILWKQKRTKHYEDSKMFPPQCDRGYQKCFVTCSWWYLLTTAV